MTKLAQMLIEQARSLTPEERLEVADAILASLDAPDHAIDRAWLYEARDRLEALRRGDIDTRDFDQVIAKHAKK